MKIDCASSLLFPGETQNAQFGKCLNRVLKEHEDEVTQLGIEIADLGTPAHSI